MELEAFSEKCSLTGVASTGEDGNYRKAISEERSDKSFADVD